MILFLNIIKIFWMLLFIFSIFFLFTEFIRVAKIVDRKPSYKNLIIGVLLIPIGYYVSGFYHLHYMDADFYYTKKMVSINDFVDENFDLFREVKKEVIRDFDEIMGRVKKEQQCFGQFMYEGNLGNLVNENRPSIKALFKERRLIAIQVCRDSSIQFTFQRMTSPKELLVSDETFYTIHKLEYQTQGNFSSIFPKSKIASDWILTPNWRYVILKERELIW